MRWLSLLVVLASLVDACHAEQSLSEQSLLEEFAQHFRCPFAHVWLKHGSEGAAKLLGIEPHKLSLNQRNVTCRNVCAKDKCMGTKTNGIPIGEQWVSRAKSSNTGCCSLGSGACEECCQATEALPRCSLAPDVIGGAHQHALSPGYTNDCSDAPGRGSPYMWPLRWKAQLEGKMMLVGTNEPIRETKGTNWYRFDKNWKRGDMYSSKQNSTVLHRGQRMVFLKWSDDIDSKITSCMWMNMTVIGNVRPDWFLDKRGAGSIDVQYLGKEHIYYMGKPRLVRKWRKNDMTDTYFTVSVDELAGFKGIHWPLVLNIPGERMLPTDSLESFYNHEVLSEDDEAAFLLDEAYIKAGGSCKMIGHSGGLPPWKFPSELEKDVNAWRSIEWTGRPSAPSDMNNGLWQGTSYTSETAFV